MAFFQALQKAVADDPYGVPMPKRSNAKRAKEKRDPNELAAAIVKQATTGSSLEPLDKLVCPKCGHRWTARKSDTAAELGRRKAKAARFLENNRRREIAKQVAMAHWSKQQS